MSQDNQNRDPQDDSQQSQDQNQGQRDDWQGESQGNQSSDEMTRASRSSGYSPSDSNSGTSFRPNPSALPELDDTDEMDDDDDREDDSRGDGSPNRRFNIG